MSKISDKQLEDLLRRDFTTSITDDDSFSARVMRALPARRRKQPWLLPGAAVFGVLFAWLSLLPSTLLQQVAHEWLTGGFGTASAWLYTLLFGISLLGCVWALAENQ